MENRKPGGTGLSDVSKLKSVFHSPALGAIRDWCAPVRSGVLLLCLFSVLVSLTSLALPLLTRSLVDSAVGRDTNLLWYYAVLLAACIIVSRILSWIVSRLRVRTSASFQMKMQERIIRDLFGKDCEALRPFHSGELVNRFFSDVTVVRNGVTEVLPSLLQTLVSFLGAAVILTTMDWRFVPVMLLGSLAWAGLNFFLRKPMKRRHKQMQQAEDSLHAAAQEAVENIRMIKAGSSEGRMLELIQKRAGELRDARLRTGILNVLMKNGIGSVMDFSWLLCYIWGCVKIFRGEFSYGSLAAMIPLVGRLQGPVANAAGLLGQVYGITASAERLRELLNLKEDVNEGSLDDFDSILLDHLSFRYGDESPEVLTDVCGEINKGDFIALTGKSGEGKTSLFQLLLGIYRPTSGRVLFRKGDCSLPASVGIRKLISYVPQGNILFSGTLRDNLTMFADHADEKEIREAVRTACLEDLVNEIGLDAMLGERGIGLSEGQGQRVAVARALLSQAPVLLLDEATSALDEQTESRMLQNIAGLKSDPRNRKTVLIVTHRPAALAICEKRWNIEDGRLVLSSASGKPDPDDRAPA